MSTSTILPTVQPIEGDLHPQSLAHLHATVVDAINGHEAFLERAEADLRPMLEEFKDVHSRHDRELAGHMARHGQEPDAEGSFLSLVHESMARLRDWFGDVDKDIVPQIVDGERRVLEAYNHALEHGQPADVNELLVRQRDELAAIVDKYDMAGTAASR
jgi:uncharacterized protein (TIGR02284 family)